jgi:hypothetical protein
MQMLRRDMATPGRYFVFDPKQTSTQHNGGRRSCGATLCVKTWADLCRKVIHLVDYPPRIKLLADSADNRDLREHPNGISF